MSIQFCTSSISSELSSHFIKLFIVSVWGNLWPFCGELNSHVGQVDVFNGLRLLGHIN